MRAAVVLAPLLFFVGCLDDPFRDEPTPTPPPEPVPEPHDLFLKPGRALDAEPPESDAPVKEAVAPTHEAFSSEDLEVHASEPQPGFLVTRAVAHVYYTADQGTVSPFRDSGTGTRHFVLWLGAGDLYNGLATVTGPARIEPGQTVSAQAVFDLPPGGLVVAPGEVLNFLVAPLLASDGTNLHWLIDHAHTPSRIEFDAFPWNTSVPSVDESVSAHEITANSGLFTGVLGGVGDTMRLTLDVPANTSYLRVDVRWKSTTGPKSDLDMVLYDTHGAVLGNSTTPYQSEHLRLWAVALPAAVTVEVIAYSGAKTTFDLAVSVA